MKYRNMCRESIYTFLLKIDRIIIKERNRNAYMDTIIREVLNNWNIQDKRIQQIHDTVWQIGDEYVLKKYDNKSIVEQNFRKTVFWMR